MIPGTDFLNDQHAATRWWLLVAFLVVLFGVLVVSAPPVESLVSNPDMGVQLSKGQQILFGLHPHIDVDTTVYGPGIFYLSALAQRVADRRLVGPLVVILVGYLTAYGLMGWVVLRRSLSSWTFVGFSALALVSIPRFYKYHVVLPQALVLVALDVGSRSPSLKRAGAVLGIGCTLATLFRVDIGGYGMIAACVLLAVRSRGRRLLDFVESVAVFGFACVATATPYLIFLAAKGDLVRMVSLAVVDSVGVAGGLALHLPEFVWGSSMLDDPNRTVVVFWCWMMVPVLGAVAAIWQDPVKGSECEKDRALILVVSLFAALVFLQASHRTDFGHVLQAIPAGLVAAALGADHWVACRGPSRRRITAGLVAAVACLEVVLLMPARLKTAATYSPKRVASVAMGWTARADDVLAEDSSKSGGKPAANVLRRLAAVTNGGDAVLCLPYMPQAYFFSGRHFVTRTGWLNPGRFISPGSETRFIASLGETRWVVDQPEFSFDRRGSRNARSYAPSLMRVIYSEFRIAEVVGRFTVLTREPYSRSPQGAPVLSLAPMSGIDERVFSSPAPEWAFRLVSRVNTLAVDGLGRDLTIPEGGGLLVDLDRGIGSAGVDLPNLRVGLVGEGGAWSVCDRGKELRASKLSPWKLIDTRALGPGNYRLVFYTPASDQDGDRSVRGHSTVVSADFVLRIKGSV